MSAIRVCVLAVIVGAGVWTGGLSAAAPARAQLPPGWTPGTFYGNVSNSPVANPGNSSMPNRRPTDPVTPPASSTILGAGWTINGWRPTPPSQSETDTPGGQYCTDASGGQVYVAAGAPTDQLTCPTQDSSTSS